MEWLRQEIQKGLDSGAATVLDMNELKHRARDRLPECRHDTGMNSVRKLPKAEEDLIGIWLRIAQDSPFHADRFLDFLDDKMRLLASSPRMARLYPELGERMHGFPVDDYIVFYREASQGIEIVRVLRRARYCRPLFH